MIPKVPTRHCLFVATQEQRPPTQEEIARQPQPRGAPAIDPRRTYFHDRILKPALQNFGYTLTVATHIGRQQATAHKTIRALLDFDLVVFDLTSAPLQLTLDLGRREAIGRPVIAAITAGSDVPTGLDHLDPIHYSPADSVLCDEARVKLNWLLAGIAPPNSTACRPFFDLVGTPVTIGGIQLTREDMLRIEETLKRRTEPARRGRTGDDFPLCSDPYGGAIDHKLETA